MTIIPATPAHAADIAQLIMTAMTEDCCQYLAGKEHTLDDFYHMMLDLVLMDVVTKNGASGLVAAEKIKAQNKKVKIIIVTSMPECSYVERAKKIGVEGFWYKDFSPEPILTLIERVLSGESVYPDDVPEIQLGLAKSGELTARELEILREMTGGFTNAEIAEKLGISEKRVRNHVANMLEKTGFRSRTELAVRAREAGIVILDRTEDDI